MLIIDAQVHIWGSGKPSDHHRQTSIYTAEELIREMDEAGVNGAVLHPPSWDPGSNEMAIEAAVKYPEKFCSLGWFALNDPAQRHRIETWKQQAGMVGLRWSLTRPGQETWHEDGTMDWLWPAAEKAGTPIATMAWRFLPLFGQIAARHPNLKLIIDHLGVVRGGKDDAAFGELGPLLALAKYPNVAVKATGAPSHSSAAYPFRNIHDGLHRIFDAFGPDRFFWGHGHHADAMQLSPVRDDVHRGADVAERRRPGKGHGPGRHRVAGLEAPGLSGHIGGGTLARNGGAAAMTSGFCISFTGRGRRASAFPRRR